MTDVMEPREEPTLGPASAPMPDPVRDMIRVVDRSAYMRGFNDARNSLPTWATVVKWAALSFVGGVLLVFVWANAHAQVPPEAQQYRRDLTRISQAIWGLDAPVALLAAQIEQESAWRADARSRVGAAGLTQFMPATARDVATRHQIGPANPLDPRWAMQAQSHYMRQLLRAIDAMNPSEQMAFALAAYNGGLGHVRTRQSMSRHPRRCINATCDIRPPGVSESNQRENRTYPRRILLVLLPRYHAAGWGGPGYHTRYGV